MDRNVGVAVDGDRVRVTVDEDVADVHRQSVVGQALEALWTAPVGVVFSARCACGERLRVVCRVATDSLYGAAVGVGWEWRGDRWVCPRCVASGGGKGG